MSSKTPDLPPIFLERMQRLLGDDFSVFQDSLQQPPSSGLRVNTLKWSPQDLQKALHYEIKQLPWTTTGFECLDMQAGYPSPGKHPYHAAGLYYLQEPSAMAVAELLHPEPGDFVLDLCAAPGGKATHLAALMKDQGLLVANETHPGRVWELAQNLERWGVHQTVIFNEQPPRLAERFRDFFDKVLVDAPCSGEGMFRKSVSARRDWNPDLVASCALRQSAILQSAAQMLKPGGVLAYSTCTFNPIENESTIAVFLQEHPDFKILEVQRLPGFSPGRPDWAGQEMQRLDLARAVRLWPHRCAGDGHFIALLSRTAGVSYTQAARISQRRNQSNTGRLPLSPAARSFQSFAQENLAPHVFESVLDTSRLRLAGAYLYQIPYGLPDLSGLHAIHPGWWLGTMRSVKKGSSQRFEPSHALALGLRIEDARRVMNLEADDPLVHNYLRGLTLPWGGEDGWLIVSVDGYPLGWGKGSHGQIKNFYPRGLRWL